jgi:pyruvate dehydrogenase complex dihydrolipoamide acetyltransferase long form
MGLVVAGATFLLLFLAFGSLLMPLKAILLNVATLAATLGVVTWVFQEGHLSSWLGFESTGFVEVTQPILVMTLVFGLSMDYEVFLLSRIREQYDRSGNNRVAVAAGMQRTGRIITSAALLILVVIGFFSASSLSFIKLIGVAMIVAIVLDALLVRMVVVPATMRLLGDANWWLPGPLARVYSRFGIREEGDGSSEPDAAGPDAAGPDAAPPDSGPLRVGPPGMAPAEAGPRAGAPAAAAAEGAAPNGAPARIMSSPLARRLVREHGLRLEDLTGTGPGGRIVRDDVRRAVAARELANASSPARPEGRPHHPQRTVGWEDVPHTRMRRAIAGRLAESNREAPHFAIRGTARVDDLLALRAQLNSGDGQRISVNDLVVAAVARSHARLPEMNVVWTPDAVRRYAAVDVGIAVATERGLVTPVLRAVETRTVSSIARDAADLTERARAGALRQDELEGGTITVSNLGGYGVEEFTAVLNPPQAAILAVGAARKEAVVDGDALAVATVLHVTLTVDHRPVDGALAARWMAAFIALLEDPLRILA